MFRDMQISAIAAVAANGIIGRDGKLPWRIPNDLKHFKRLTVGHACIMGRKTFDELGKPLPKRMNIVVSRTLVAKAERLVVVRTLTEAFAAAIEWERDAAAAGKIAAPEVFVIGGAQLWVHAWPYIDRLYQTRVLADFQGDTAFPAVDLRSFEPLETRPGTGPGPPHEFVTLQRRS